MESFEDGKSISISVNGWCVRVRGALMGKFRPVLARAILVSCLGLVLAACGSSSSASKSGETRTTTGGSSTTKNVSFPRVTIAKAVNTEDLVAVNIAQNEGLFKKAGVDVKTILVGGSSIVNSSLQSGGVQFGLASAASVLLAASHNIPLQSVGAIDQGDNAQLVIANSWIRSHGLSQSQPISARIKGLEGTKFARLSSSDGAALTDFEKGSGVPSSSITSVSINSEAAMLTALQHGEVQEFIASPPTSTIAVAEGLGTVLASAKDLKYGAGQEYNVLITTPSYAKAHPGIVTAVTTAIGEALAQMASGSSAAIIAVHTEFPTLSNAVIKKSLQVFSFANAMKQSSSGWDDALSFARATGLVKQGSSISVNQGGIWTNQYLK